MAGVLKLVGRSCRQQRHVPATWTDPAHLLAAGLAGQLDRAFLAGGTRGLVRLHVVDLEHFAVHDERGLIVRRRKPRRECPRREALRGRT